MKSTGTSVFRTRARTEEDVSMHPIDSAACVVEASWGSAVRQTLMNVRQHLVFEEGGGLLVPAIKIETLQIVQKLL